MNHLSGGWGIGSPSVTSTEVFGAVSCCGWAAASWLKGHDVLSVSCCGCAAASGLKGHDMLAGEVRERNPECGGFFTLWGGEGRGG